MLTAALLPMKTWGEEDSLQGGVLRIRNSQCLCQRFTASIRACERHATFIWLSKVCALGDTEREAETAAGRKVSRLSALEMRQVTIQKYRQKQPH
jgi:hypothetical protein